MELLILFLPFLALIGFRGSERFKLPLSKRSEEKYIDLYYNKQQEEAKKVLIERNLRLVANIAKKYVSKKNEIEDLLSIGTIGLIKGINTFDSKKNNKLSTYVSRCIENEILMHLRKVKNSNEDIYLDDSIANDKDGKNFLIVDTIKSDEKSIEDIVSNNIDMNRVKKVFNEVLNKREQYIIKKRYGIFKEKKITQTQIAKRLGISRSYVSRIEKAALQKLRRKIDS